MDVKNQSQFIDLFSLPELFEELIKYLDSYSIVNLIFTSHELYIRYAYSNYTVTKLISKTLDDLNIKLPILRIYLQLNTKEQRLIFHDLISICLYFNHFPKNSFGIGDLIVFLVDRNKIHNTSYILFEQLLIQMNKTACNPRVRRIHGVDCNQVTNLLVHCDSRQLQLLFEQLVIPKNVICTTIKNLLGSKTNNTDNTLLVTGSAVKIKECIRYFLIKSTFGNNKNTNYSNDYFLSDILYEIVNYNRIELMDYILQKRDFLHIYFDYSSIILKCIEQNRIEMLNILFKHRNSTFQNKKPLYITGDLIKKIVKQGNFEMLYWVVDNLLGSLINLNHYILRIIDGIYNCQNLESLYFIFYLSKYLKNSSKEKINDALCFIYYQQNIQFYETRYFTIEKI
jgi:hypothetical protein